MLSVLAAGFLPALRQSARERRRLLEQEAAKVAAVQARVAERVVGLFGQVSDARPGSGRTAAAFAAVERAFQRAAAAYGTACQRAGLLQVQERLRQVRRLGRQDPSGAVH